MSAETAQKVQEMSISGKKLFNVLQLFTNF